uniref:Uncharacterized protein n=1 Tax=Babesia bovis TaxID=5865 RepID=S6B081_BABBO|nr:hypothetical protein [Babesia bovis]
MRPCRTRANYAVHALVPAVTTVHVYNRNMHYTLLNILYELHDCIPVPKYQLSAAMSASGLYVNGLFA